MPPDLGGRDRHVRDVTAPFFQNPSRTLFVNFPVSSPITPDSTPPNSHSLLQMKSNSTSPSVEDIGLNMFNSQSVHSIHANITSTPMLSPSPSSDSFSFDSMVSSCPDSKSLDHVFPYGLKEVEGIHNITATLPGGLQGVLVDKNSGTRSIYIFGLNAPSMSKQCVKALLVEILDLADEKLEADEVIVVLDKHQSGMRELLQGLLYVGGNVIRNQEDPVADSVVLIGIEL
ncbi:uncharacterized protein MELLADRAFT_71684 [Melampsora larici-populina 98AG31]|uniref:Ornithine decarboxylase antizyme n=1 Tax=Melampsora larici-populina (strain 98AG31 / pathotype 3-4-7) TaxID=747676 RepID=F4RJG6_MELLP|nr:uncharacterized protein MELLADRAFT_71684 [Melampsora larici-populina 98AG31]EGG07497.1 hypothetical protein MELLADRAFT_71684 [Melampsora larici-populina 98AG31]